MPVRVMVDGSSIAEYTWESPLRLRNCVDINKQLMYEFIYERARAPKAVRIYGSRLNLGALGGIGNVDCEAGVNSLLLDIGVDQVDSVRRLTTRSGHTIKYVDYDSFGNVTLETEPEFAFPLGFAGGLKDQYTGLVRFGFRDYDPQTGRFTTKDPLGDTGGDHDLWEYCVDDPVSMNDPTGLIAPFLLAAAGYLASALGAGGFIWGAAELADYLDYKKTGVYSHKGREGLKKVAAPVAGTLGAAALPLLTIPGAGSSIAAGATALSRGAGRMSNALTHGAQKASATWQTQAPAIVRGAVEAGVEAGIGATIPIGNSVTATTAEQMGAITKRVYDETRHHYRNNP